MNKSIMICGVGGQGTLLASRILGAAIMRLGYDVKMSEVHGMSQRGGSVVTYVNYSDKAVYSPIIAEGCADVILGFELLESYRCLPFLKKGGKMITNTQRINPMPVITGAMEYPDDIEGKLTGMKVDITTIDALKLASEAGNEKTVNVVLIGAMTRIMGLDTDVMKEALASSVKPKLLEVNQKAFSLGYNSIS